MGNATSAGLGSEASHDERDIRHGGQYSDNRPIDIELAEEAKESEVPRPPASYSGAQAVGLEVKSREAVPAKITTCSGVRRR